MTTNDDRIKIIEEFTDRIEGVLHIEGAPETQVMFHNGIIIYNGDVWEYNAYQLFLVRCVEWIFVNDHIDFRPIYLKYDNAWHDTILYFETPEKVLHKSPDEAREAALLWYLKQEVK